MSTTTEYTGIVHGLDELVYHRLPGLASTGAKRLIQRSPAHYRWEQEHRTEKAAYDFGHVVHGLVLGTGLEVDVIDADSWRSKAAQDERRAAYAAGHVPMLAADYDRAVNAALAVKVHPVAGPLFHGGSAEVSLFWTDETTGVECRGRLDYLRPDGIVDLKTTRDANPADFGRAVAKFGYDLQTAWYRGGYEAITGERLRFVHVLVETEEPHAVSVIELDEEALHVGALKAARAREIYAECTSTGQWPGYDPTVIHPVGLPTWAVYEAEDTYDPADVTL